jgi:hypothetical protein
MQPRFHLYSLRNTPLILTVTIHSHRIEYSVNFIGKTANVGLEKKVMSAIVKYRLVQLSMKNMYSGIFPFPHQRPDRLFGVSVFEMLGPLGNDRS